MSMQGESPTTTIPIGATESGDPQSAVDIENPLTERFLPEDEFEATQKIAQANRELRDSLMPPDDQSEVRRIIQELMGPDANWERLINYLIERRVTVVGGVGQMANLQQMFEGFTQDGSQELNLATQRGRDQLAIILRQPGILERTFNIDTKEALEMSEEDKDKLIADFIETTSKQSQFVITTGLALQADDQALIEDPEGFRDFILPVFGGTPADRVENIGDLVSGMSFHPKEIAERLSKLPDQDLTLVQARLYDLGFYQDNDGNGLLPRWGDGRDEATQTAMNNFAFDLIGAIETKGKLYSADDFLFDRRIENAKIFADERMTREERVANDARSQFAADVGRDIGGLTSDALSVALEESGASLTEKGRQLFDSIISDGVKNLSGGEVKQIMDEEEANRNVDIDKLLAAYYTDGQFVGDWGANIVIGAENSKEYAHYGLMAGVISEEEARLLYTPAHKMPFRERSRVAGIRQRLDDNIVDIARIAMKNVYNSSATLGQQPMASEALRTFNQTFGKATNAVNNYDNNHMGLIIDSLDTEAAIDWLGQQDTGTPIADSIEDQMAQNAIDALGLPEKSDYNPVYGAAIDQVLNSIARTGRIG